MKLQLVLGLIGVQYNSANVLSLASVITDAECSSKILTKENLAYARRLCPRVGSSPKLSKVLISMGLPEKVVSVILSAPNPVSLPRVSSELEDLMEQGDSKHYDSCQRTGGKLNVIKNEVKFLGKSLWLFVIGQRRSVDSEGFLARAKIRLLTKDLPGQEPAAFYVERPYGQHAALLQNLEVLSEWVGNWCEEKGLPSLPLLIAPVWDRDNGGGRDFQQMYGGRYHTPLYCPSAEEGYQDTMTHGLGSYNFFEEVEPEKEEDYKKRVRRLVRKVYRERPSADGVYLCSLKEHNWNPQKFTFLYPPLPRGWRGTVTPQHREQIRTLINYLGYPKTRIVFEEGYILYRESHDTPWFRIDGGALYVAAGNDWLKVIDDNVVFCNLPEHGFFEPIDAVNGWVEGKIGESLSKKTLLNFWLDTLGFPEKGERFIQDYHCFAIIHKGQKFMVRFFANGIGQEIALEVPSDGLFPDEKTVFSYNGAKREYRVHYSLPELGFCKAVPIITYKVNDSLWVTGPLPTK